MVRKKVRIGEVLIGPGEPVRVQSMTSTHTDDIRGTVNQIRELEKAGCEIVRVAVPDFESAWAIREIKKQTKIPLVADIHFDYRLAIKAVEAGADKIRINPGNIGSDWKVREVVKACKERDIPMRVGANAGSLKKELRGKMAVEDALVESVREEVKILEDMGFDNIVISIKASDVGVFIRANQKAHREFHYPFHIGVTEAGPVPQGIVKSSIGIGFLLMNGIGDTIRVSLTADPVEEIEVAYDILASTGIRKVYPEIISCPTCGRMEIDLLKLIEKVKPLWEGLKIPLKIAVMGCAVNGPGEAREADIGIAGGRGYGLIFRKGEIIKSVPKDDLYNEFKRELQKLIREVENAHEGGKGEG